MKTKKILLIAFGSLFAICGIIFAADHADAPAVTGKTTDITDMYVFQGENTSNLVFVANSQGLLSPAATATTSFDNNTIIQFNIDNNADNVEDLVIQCGFYNGKMYVYGPVKPSQTGLTSKVTGSSTVSVDITKYGETAKVGIANGMMAFAGPRDDPFFFDLDQYKAILAGTATGFKTVGTDKFAGTNVMSVVVEVPKTMLNATSGKVNVWVEAKRKI
jgi:hypothetical protein